jgi:hypothetical protein
MNDINGNTNTVYLVFEDKKRDYSAAEQFGKLKVVYSSIGRNFSPQAVIEHARRVLANMEPEDYLVMSGDPALCAICVTVAAEFNSRVRILRWDRNSLSYSGMTLVFD